MRPLIKRIAVEMSFVLDFVQACTSVVRAFAHGGMGRRIDPSWGGPGELFLLSSQCSTTGVTKAMVCTILSVAHVAAAGSPLTI